MHDAGDRTACARADIGRRAGDRSGGAHAAERHGGDIGQALGDEFAVGAVLAPAHAVGDDGRQQAFDGAEQGDGEGVRENGAHLGKAKPGSEGAGSVRGTSPNFEPMVETSRCRAARLRWSSPQRRSRSRANAV